MGCRITIEKSLFPKRTIRKTSNKFHNNVHSSEAAKLGKHFQKGNIIPSKDEFDFHKISSRDESIVNPHGNNIQRKNNNLHSLLSTFSLWSRNSVLFQVTFYMISVSVMFYSFTSVYRLTYISTIIVTTSVILSVISELVTRRKLKNSVKHQKNSEDFSKVIPVCETSDTILDSDDSDIDILIQRISNLSLLDDDSL